ncbi:beta-sarcoglycan [Galendromus occidentalis]|uniref:Beta-sarcoglycan n=1 Tax=Galendromus occidentalis TaxID=34638 RepID=A0AAJ7SGI2_9ACAR|nr:beta-sarcoglycan [Galendromus occidentalis]
MGRPIEGRAALLVYILVITLLILSIVNFCFTLLIFGVLRVGPSGMSGLEFLPDENLMWFLQRTDIQSIVAHRSKISSFKGQDLNIVGENSDVVLNAGAELRVGPRATRVSRVEEMRVVSPKTGKTVFSTDFKNFKIPKGVPNLSVSEAHVKKIRSPFNESLLITSEKQVYLKGNAGVHIKSKNISVRAAQDIHLKSVHGKVVLDAKQIIFNIADMQSPEPGPPQYRLCVCGSNGRVFRVAVREQGYTCNHVRFPISENPCT